jgi:tripartite-type tricarboxylate transporter receptor subunit TctC
MVVVLMMLIAVPGLTAEKFPDKQITVICPWPPGGRSDMTTRIIAAVLEKNLGQPV